MKTQQFVAQSCIAIAFMVIFVLLYRIILQSQVLMAVSANAPHGISWRISNVQTVRIQTLRRTGKLLYPLVALVLPKFDLTFDFHPRAPRSGVWLAWVMWIYRGCLLYIPQLLETIHLPHGHQSILFVLEAYRLMFLIFKL